MSMFTLDLSDHLRALLEEHRQRLGARSLAQAIRLLIDPPLPEEEVGRVMKEIYERENPKVQAKAAERAPIKSRLKGEWKAP